MQLSMGVEESRQALVYREFPGIYEEGAVGAEATNVQLAAFSFYEALSKWARDPNLDSKADMISCGRASQEALVSLVRAVESCTDKTDYDKAYLIGGILVRLDDDRAACLQATPNGYRLTYPSADLDKEVRINNMANDILDCFNNGDDAAEKIHDAYIDVLNGDIDNLINLDPQIAETEQEDFDVYTEVFGVKESRREALIRHVSDIGKIAVGVSIGLVIYAGAKNLFSVTRQGELKSELPNFIP